MVFSHPGRLPFAIGSSLKTQMTYEKVHFYYIPMFRKNPL